MTTLDDMVTIAPQAKGPWDLLVCTLPGCDAPLYMERTTSLQLVAGQTVEEVRTGENVASWQVTCQEGHVLLLSGDDEYAQFGLCRDDHGDPHPEEPHDCKRLDVERLRKIARVGRHEHIRHVDRCRDCGDDLAPKGTPCPVDGCALSGPPPHDHDWTASPEARVADYLR